MPTKGDVGVHVDSLGLCGWVGGEGWGLYKYGMGVVGTRQYVFASAGVAVQQCGGGGSSDATIQQQQQRQRPPLSNLKPALPPALASAMLFQGPCLA